MDGYGAEFAAVVAFAEQGYTCPDWDGLKEWTQMKSKYSEENTGDWAGPILSEPYASYRERILSEMREYTESGATIPAAHFYIQCLRVPYKNKFSQLRLMQVAYNIGQLRGALQEVDPSYMKTFYALRLDKIETYYVA